MRRHHNPRYAPEALERKLHPSGIAAIPVAAEVHIPKTQPSNPSPMASMPVDMGQDDEATTPADPTANVVVLAMAETSGAPGHVPTIPGSPEPTAPDHPQGGTGPAPPDGDGTPPLDQPSTPGGTPVPA